MAAKNKLALRNVHKLLKRMVVLPPVPPISEIAFDLLDKYALSHGWRIPDALIASTALSHELPLYTRETRHYQFIPGLTIIAPY